MIREAKLEDLDGILTLYRHLHADDDPPPDRDTVRKIWAEMLGSPLLHCLVTEIDGTLAASCCLAILPNLTRGGRSYGIIENVVTHEAYRRQGHGTALIRHALEVAWRARCYKVLLQTGSREDSVYRFYERCGFVRGEKTGFVARPVTSRSPQR